MAAEHICETALSVRLDPTTTGQWCVGCGEVQAAYQPEIYLHTDATGYLFLCKVCAWDHAPWLVSIINMGHYSDWAPWGGTPPSPQRLVELELTVADMLGEPGRKIALPGAVANDHSALLLPEAETGFDQVFADTDFPTQTGGLDNPLAVEPRRVEPRYNIIIPAKLSIQATSSPPRTLSVTTRNVSNSGAYLLLDDPPTTGAHVGLKMIFPARGILLARGSVARSDTSGVGVRFRQTRWQEAT